VDDFYFGGSEYNYAHWRYNSNFKVVKHNIAKPLDDSLKFIGKLDIIFHLASVTHQALYTLNFIEPLDIIYFGTKNVFEYAKKKNALVLIASSFGNKIYLSVQ
jgi:nucleoside-diphosphate-sugar epimerase